MEKKNAEITISDEVKYIRENAFNSLLSSTSQKFSIRSVVLNNNIETLPKYAFAGNKEIKVYTNKEIMIQRYTFDNCGEIDSLMHHSMTTNIRFGCDKWWEVIYLWH